MVDELAERVFQFLAAYWYPRSETDGEVIDEFAREVGAEGVRERAEVVRRYLALEEPDDETRERFVRYAAAGREFGNSPDAALTWLARILRELERRSA